MFAQVFTGMGDGVGVNKILLVIGCKRIHLLHLRISEPASESMFQGFVRIRLIVIELELAGIARDQPGGQLVIATREIEMGKFCTIIHPVEIIMFGGPCGKVAVHRSEIRDGEYIPPFFYVYLYIGLIAPEIFQVYDDLIEQMSIYQPIVRHLECGDQAMQAHRITRLKRQLPFDDIVLCFFVPRYIDLANGVWSRSISNSSRRHGGRLRRRIGTKEQGYYRPEKFQIFR